MQRGPRDKLTLFIDILIGNLVLLLSDKIQDVGKHVLVARRSGILSRLVLGIVEIEIAEEASYATTSAGPFVIVRKCSFEDEEWLFVRNTDYFDQKKIADTAAALNVVIVSDNPLS